jgi:hypothetical protein
MQSMRAAWHLPLVAPVGGEVIGDAISPAARGADARVRTP